MLSLIWRTLWQVISTLDDAKVCQVESMDALRSVVGGLAAAVKAMVGYRKEKRVAGTSLGDVCKQLYLSL